MSAYTNCQSCGMPLNQDPNAGEMYCSYCYRDGKFTQPDMTADEMKAFVVEKMREMKIPRFIGRFFVRNLHRLERWRT
jgi:uncharacterized Zn finger protein (UPF0148 family)